jgi:hypothetical protein
MQWTQKEAIKQVYRGIKRGDNRTDSGKYPPLCQRDLGAGSTGEGTKMDMGGIAPLGRDFAQIHSASRC